MAGPKAPPGGAMAAKVMRPGGLIDANSVNAAIAVGDTIQVFLEAIRASIPAGTYKAIVRLVTPDIVIAEDLRIFSRDSSFTRANSTPGAPLYNTPMTDVDLQQIAAEYAQNARVQGDRFFGDRHNNSTTQNPGRPIAVHSLMFASNIWGYTYSTTNYFVWDYWVSTNGSTKSVAQHAQRRQQQDGAEQQLAERHPLEPEHLEEAAKVPCVAVLPSPSGVPLVLAFAGSVAFSRSRSERASLAKAIIAPGAVLGRVGTSASEARPAMKSTAAVVPASSS